MNMIQHLRLVLLRLAIVLPALVGAGSLRAAEIQGRVLNWLTGEPVVAALVSVKGGSHAVPTSPDGRYLLRDLAPGLHVITVSRDNYVTLGQGEVTASETGRVEAPDIFLFPQPSVPGVHGLSGDQLQNLDNVAERLATSYRGDMYFPASKEPRCARLDNPFQLLIYAPPRAPALLEYIVRPISRRPLTGSNSIRNRPPTPFLILERERMEVTSQEITPGLTLVSGSLPPGLYAVQLRLEFDAPDAFYAFELAPRTERKLLNRKDAAGTARSPACQAGKPSAYIVQEASLLATDLGPMYIRAVQEPGRLPAVTLDDDSCRTLCRMMFGEAPGDIVNEGDPNEKGGVRFRVLLVPGMLNPLILGMAEFPREQVPLVQASLIGLVEGGWRVLLPEPLDVSRGGIHLGPLGRGRGTGLAHWHASDGETPAAPRHYQVELYRLGPAGFERIDTMTTRDKYQEAGDALRELGLAYQDITAMLVRTH